MRRIRLATGPGALFLAMFALAMIAFLPLRLALGWFGLAEQGMTARKVTGTMWAGSLSEARFGAVALGDLKAGLSPLHLLVGRARVDLDGRATPPAPRLSGALEVTRHSFGTDSLTASLPVAGVFGPVPITTLDLDDVTVRFNGTVCERAEGRVRAQMAGGAGDVVVPGLLSGTARCDAGALLLPLASQAGSDGATLRIWPDGRYRAELTLAASDPLVAQRLERVGFIRTGQGYQIAIDGRF